MSARTAKLEETDKATLEQLARITDAYNRSILKGREKAPGKTRRPAVQLFWVNAEQRCIEYMPIDIRIAAYKPVAVPSRGCGLGQVPDQAEGGDKLKELVVATRERGNAPAEPGEAKEAPVPKRGRPRGSRRVEGEAAPQ